MKYQTTHRTFLFIAYMMANLYAVLHVIITGEFMDFGSVDQDFSLSKFIYFSFVFALVYYFIMYPCFNFVSRIRFKTNGILDDRLLLLLGWIVLFIQTLYFLIVIAFDAGRVGSNVGVEDVPFSKIWAFFQIDFLAAYYLFLSRRSGIWWVNLFIYAISNLIRGWTGFFLILFFLYFTNISKFANLNYKKILFFAIFSFALLPVILFLKFYFRSNYEASDFREFLAVVFGFDNLMDYLKFSIEYFIIRIQQISLSWHPFEHRGALSIAYESGHIVPFWLENLYGNLVYKLFELPPANNLGVFITSYIPYKFDFEYGSFNASPGIIIWISILKNSLPFFLVFSACILLLSFVVIQLLARRGSAEWMRLSSLVWLMWFVLFLPGWINQFVAFLHAGVVLCIICFILKSSLRKNLN